jgi:hypothetical protein
MSIIKQIQKNYKTVSIIGLAKNAGKTVALNYLIDKAYEENITIGITSTGRDGENSDLVTNTEKPNIFVTEGILVATAKQALLMSDAKLEILETTDFKTAMGDIILARVKHSGDIQIAGPTNTKEIKIVSNMLNKLGAEIVIVDGAIDRKASSSPLITDACIIATGAVLSRDMKKVIEKTAYTVECYQLNQVEYNIRKKLKKGCSTCIIDDTGEIACLYEESGISAAKVLSENIDAKAQYVYVRGAITSMLLNELSKHTRAKDFKLVIDDATKIFADLRDWNEAKKRGLKIEVLDSIKILAITLNPVSPEGYYFDSAKFLEKMQYYIKGIDIIDVLAGV